MINMNKKYTYNGRPARIYADGSDTAGGYIHAAYMGEAGNWCSYTFLESDLVEVCEPKEGEWCFFWTGTVNSISISKFKNLLIKGFVDVNGNYWENCAPFTGTLPEAFKGL